MRMQSSSGRTKILPSPISPLLPRTATFDDGVDRRLDEFLVDGDLELHFSQQIDGDLVAPVDLVMPLLATETLHIHDGQAKHLDFGQSRFHRFQTSRLNDGDNQLHPLHSMLLRSDLRVQPSRRSLCPVGNARWCLGLFERGEIADIIYPTLVLTSPCRQGNAAGGAT